MHQRSMATGIILALLKGRMVWMKNIGLLFISLLTVQPSFAEGASVLRFSPCEKSSTGQLKAQPKIQALAGDGLVDLRFVSKSQTSYALVDLSAVAASGAIKSLGSYKVTEVMGGQNFLPTQIKLQDFSPAFLMMRINDSQCFYAQVNPLKESDFQIATLEPKVLPFALSYEIQSARFDLVSFILAFGLFLSLYLWLEHSRSARRRLELSL